MKTENQAEIFSKALKADGSIDKRSSFGKALRAMRSALQDDLKGTAKDILENQIAALSLLEQSIMAHILGQPNEFVVDGQLNKMISIDLLKFQAAQRAALNQLAGLSGRGSMKNANGKGRDLDLLDL